MGPSRVHDESAGSDEFRTIANTSMPIIRSLCRFFSVTIAYAVLSGTHSIAIYHNRQTLWYDWYQLLTHKVTFLSQSQSCLRRRDAVHRDISSKDARTTPTGRGIGVPHGVSTPLCEGRDSNQPQRYRTSGRRRPCGNHCVATVEHWRRGR